MENTIISNNTKINALLEEVTMNFFPKDGKWGANCFKKSKELNILNLPCNLRDDLWITKMFKRNNKVSNIDTNTILKFVKTSNFFREKRHQYEQEIVKWQINWMNHNGSDWIINENYGSDLVLFNPTCDIGYRKGIVDTLTQIGINIDAIEEGIEKNASNWREKLMNLAFINEYDLIEYNPFNSLISTDKAVEKNDPEFKKNWIKMRKYQYYQQHKDSVDKYGIVDSDMTLSDDEVTKLKIYLNQKHIERKKQIEQYKNNIDVKANVQNEQKVLKKKRFFSKFCKKHYL